MENIYTNGHFYSASQFFKEKFGLKVYKISLDAGCTCPNRDGFKGIGGCIFCSESGSGDFASDRNKSIENQIADGKALVSKKIKNGKYIAYFQNFTSTYGDEKSLLKKYKTALNQKDIIGLSIATRPDCLNDSMLKEISEIAEKYFVILELGLQTSNEETGKFINRLYTNEDYTDCLLRIKKFSSKIHIVTHLIFGLPYESEEDMLKSLSFAIKNGTNGIKISVLHVLRNSRLYELYKNGFVKTLSMEEYFGLLGKAILMTPPEIVFHRITGDGSKKYLVSPLWTMNKKKVLNAFTHYLKENEIVQGKNF